MGPSFQLILWHGPLLQITVHASGDVPDCFWALGLHNAAVLHKASWAELWIPLETDHWLTGSGTAVLARLILSINSEAWARST